MQNLQPSKKFVPYAIALAAIVAALLYFYGHKTAEAPDDIPTIVSPTSAVIVPSV